MKILRFERKVFGFSAKKRSSELSQLHSKRPKNEEFLVNFGLRAKHVRSSGATFLTGLSNLHSALPAEDLGENVFFCYSKNNFFKKSYLSLRFSDFGQKRATGLSKLLSTRPEDCYEGEFSSRKI